MKLSTQKWIVVTMLLSIVWISLMAGLSYKYLVEKAPVPVGQLTSEHWPR